MFEHFGEVHFLLVPWRRTSIFRGRVATLVLLLLLMLVSVARVVRWSADELLFEIVWAEDGDFDEEELA